MRRALAVGGACLFFVACAPVADVVAYSSGEEPAPTSIPSSVPSPPSTGSVYCTSSPYALALRTKDGRIGGVTERGTMAQFFPVPPECTVPGTGPIAMTHDGTVWTASAGTVHIVDPKSGACKALGLTLDATAMAFVFDARTGSELLYAIVEGQLVVVDPRTLLRTPIGKVLVPDAVVGLGGTIDGRLFALTGREKPVIYELRLGDASAGPGYPLLLASSQDDLLAGLAVTISGAAVVTDSVVHWLDPKLSAPAERLPHSAPGTVAAGGSPCSALPF